MSDITATKPARHLPWTAVPAEQLNPLLIRQFIAGEQAMISRIQLKRGCLVPTHAHHNEQISVVLAGRMLFTVGHPGATEEITVGPGEVLVLPGHTPHSALALEDSENVDFFAPPREDWISGSDAYLR